MIYEYIVKNELNTTEVLQPYYYGATTCQNGIFATDSLVDVTNTATGCTVNKIPTSLFEDININLFNIYFVQLCY